MKSCVLAALTAILLTIPVMPAQAADGEIVSQQACEDTPARTYDAYLETAKSRHAEEVENAKREGHAQVTPPIYLTKAEFERRAKEETTIDCRQLRYSSDGLQIAAFLWKPKTLPAGKKLPLIIFNRGGNANLSVLTPTNSFRRFVLDGFVVLGSQYRGAGGSEGRDEFGGADVNDVLNLLPVAESLGYVDMKNVFLFGWSRGGMMTALALKRGMKVNAAAIGGPLTNMFAERERRPGLAARVWSQVIPGYAEKTDEVMRERSAVFWADQIRVPLLVMHGGADWRADPAETLAFAQALQRAGAAYELVIYAGDDHAITLNKQDSNRRVVEWFRRHMR
jgi:dipeptidyl aminopeptidase/acylaminoacyl peptidase